MNPLSASHTACVAWWTRVLPVCPFRAVARVRVRRSRPATQTETTRKSMWCMHVCEHDHHQAIEPCHRIITMRIDMYVCMYVRAYICIGYIVCIAATTWTAFQSVDWLETSLRAFPPVSRTLSGGRSSHGDEETWTPAGCVTAWGGEGLLSGN